MLQTFLPDFLSKIAPFLYLWNRVVQSKNNYFDSLSLFLLYFCVRCRYCFSDYIALDVGWWKMKKAVVAIKSISRLGKTVFCCYLLGLLYLKVNTHSPTKRKQKHKHASKQYSKRSENTYQQTKQLFFSLYSLQHIKITIKYIVPCYRNENNYRNRVKSNYTSNLLSVKQNPIRFDGLFYRTTVVLQKRISLT